MTSAELPRERLPGPTSAPWTVAVHPSADDWDPVGAGVLIDGQRVLTCAHVVRAHREGRDIWVAFPMLGLGEQRIRAGRVLFVEGQPIDICDVAVIVLERPAPAGALPAPLRDPHASSLVGDEWWAFGFPNNDPFGNSAHGRVGTELAYGWMRLDTSSSYFVEQGFSGGGVWSQAYGAVVGLVGQASIGGDNRGDGRALTLRQISAWLPQQNLADLTRWDVAASGDEALAAWGWSLDNDPEAGVHWRPRARGVGRESEQGYRFSGRTVALRTIVSWLTREITEQRVLIVTGMPGVGKSAVLGRVVTTADAGIVTALPPSDDGVRAPVGSIACAVHAKGKTAFEVATEIARAASLPLPKTADALIEAVQEAFGPVSARPRFNVVIDALDEASSPAEARAIVEEVVLPLVRRCGSLGVQVIVGSRWRDDGGDLLPAFGTAAEVLDLDREPYFEEDDLVAYAFVTLQLRGDERTGNPYSDPAVAEPVARRIAQLAEGNFLIAGLVARAHGLLDTVAVQPESLAFDASVGAALSMYVDRLRPVADIAASTVLAVLAFADAPGLPLSLWHSGLAAWGTPVAREQLVEFARSGAANFLVDVSGPGAEPSYRLFHQALNEALLHVHRISGDLHTRESALASAWIQHGREVGWWRASNYLLRSLPGHAAVAGLVDDLLLDNVYLRYADLARLKAQADHAATDTARQRARLLYLTPHADATQPDERTAMFHLTSVLEGIDPPYPSSGETPYLALWAAARRRAERNMLAGHTGRVNAICVVETTERPLLASASTDSLVFIWDGVTGQRMHELVGHSDWVKAICAVPAGAGRSLLASASDDGTIRVWDPILGQLLHTLTGHTGGVTSLCATPIEGGQYVLTSAGDDGTVRIWDPTTGQALWTMAGHTGGVTALCAVPTSAGHRVASASDDGTVRLWDSTIGRGLRTLTGHNGGVAALCVLSTRDGTLLACGGTASTVRMWDPDTGDLVHTLTGHSGSVNTVSAISMADGQALLASGSNDRTVRVWDPASGRLVQVLSGHTGPISAVCVVASAADGRPLLASASTQRIIRVWDPVTGRLVRTLTGHTGGVNALCVIPAGTGRVLLASASRDRTIRLWDQVASLRTAAETHLPPAAMESVALTVVSTSTDRSLLASSSTDGMIRLWNPESGQTVHALTGHASAITAMAAVPAAERGHLLLSGSNDGAVLLWNPTTNRLLQRLSGHTGTVTSLCSLQAGSGRLLASASADRTVRLWDRDTGSARSVLSGHADIIAAICAVPTSDGVELVASASADQSVRLWDPRDGSPCAVLVGHTEAVAALAVVVADGGRTLLASAGLDRTVRIWDPESGTSIRTLIGHTDWVTALCAITVDGICLLASASDDHTIRIWDPATGRGRHTLSGHTSGITALRPLRRHDGRIWLLSAGSDYTVRVWNPVDGMSICVVHTHHRPTSVVGVDDTFIVGSTAGLIAVRLPDSVR